jgi:hypothetical protein
VIIGDIIGETPSGSSPRRLAVASNILPIAPEEFELAGVAADTLAAASVYHICILNGRVSGRHYQCRQSGLAGFFFYWSSLALAGYIDV